MAAPTRTGTALVINASGASGTPSVTVPTDCDAIVAFWSHYDGGSGTTMGTLSYDGDSFLTAESELTGAVDTSGVGTAVLVNPSTGSNTLSWSWSSGGARSEGGHLILVYYTGADTADFVQSSATDRQSGTTTVDVSLSSVNSSDDAIIAFCGGYNASPAIQIGGTAADTTIINNNTVNFQVAEVAESTGESGSVTVAMTGEAYSFMAALAIKGASGGTAFTGTGLNEAVTVTGQAGNEQLGFEDTGTADTMAVVGYAGTLQAGASVPFVDTGLAESVSYNGQAGTLQVGTDIPFIGDGFSDSVTAAGQAGTDERGQNGTGTAEQIAVTGFAGSLISGSTIPFIDTGLAGAVTLTGRTGDAELGLVLDGLTDTVAVAGQVGGSDISQTGPFIGTGLADQVVVRGYAGSLLSNLTLTLGDIDAIAEAVYQKMVTEGLPTQLLELWQLQGLDPLNPMTVTPGQRVAGTIELTLTGDEETTSTATRTN